MSVWLYLEPLDVLYLRGNNLFGGPGDHAEALMPPWPSVFSGALRSALLVRAGVDLGRFTDEAAEHSRTEYRDVLGTPENPGSFRLAGVTLARAAKDELEPVLPLPADLVVERKREADADDRWIVRRLRPTAWPAALSPIRHGGPTTDVPVLVSPQAGKAEGGWWLSAAGWEAYRQGGVPQADQLVPSGDLWKPDFRLGIARSRESYTAEEGRIYTTRTVAMKPHTGFLVQVEGCPAELLHGVDLVRLGGDGRGARVQPLPQAPIDLRPVPPDEKVALFLLTPGLFPQGWLPPGAAREGNEYRLRCEGFSARLRCAVVPRAQVVSGWDLPAHRPKPAQRAVPAGSVYYLDEVVGDVHQYVDHLWDLVCDELTQRGGKDRWDVVWKQRKAEGFNNVLVVPWPTGETKES